MTVKGQIVGALCGFAVASPYRKLAERWLTLLGHRYPTSRTVQSFSRHFGTRLMTNEGAAFQRIVTFESGGKMHCGADADGEIGLACLMHYFLGTITGQVEDERPIVRLFDKFLRPGDVFFDVGANIGFYSLYVGPICGQRGAVHAFEANPALIPHLKRSIEMNAGTSNIHLNAVAVGQRSDEVLRLYDPDRIGNSSFYAHGWLNKERWVEVPVVALDDYVRRTGVDRIDAMKIDIEGAELDAFKGMERIFEACAPRVIVCELMPAAVETRSPHAAHPREIVEFLQSQGYMLREIVGADGRLRSPSLDVSNIESANHVINVAFVHSSLPKMRPELFVTDQ